MPHFGDHRLYAITARDAERISALLRTVADAICDLISCRGIPLREREYTRPLEESAFEQAGEMFEDSTLPLDKLF